MPALITHHLFGEESIDRLPQGVITSDEERIAFILGNQGPDPFFFHILTPRVSDCTLLAQVMHRSRMSRQFSCLRDGVSHLQPRDANLGRAFALGLLSHYVLDRNAHPFVYEQQFGIVDSDPELEASGSQVHAVLESDLDVLMLQLKRDGATVEDYPPAGEIVTTDNGYADKVDTEKDILKIAVVERHKNTHHIGLGYIQGYGLKSGAVATSISHDSHNIIVVGTNSADMAFAANYIVEHHGGIVVVENGTVKGSVVLEIAGIMSDRPLTEVNDQLEAAKDAAFTLGVSRGIDPFMTLSFMALPVIPKLRITTRGVVDVDTQQYV